MNLCPTVAGHRCSTTDCPGKSNPAICDHLARLAVWRTLTIDDQIRKLNAAQSTIDPALRDRVNACRFRGSVLPLSQQDDCGCRGREVSECRDGRGSTPGRVTLRDCLNCQEKMMIIDCDDLLADGARSVMTIGSRRVGTAHHS